MLTPRILLQGANRLNDLVLFGKATRGVFGIHLSSVCHDIENAAAALDQLDLGAELFLECGLQPGGTRKIVSADAVCNGDFHPDSFMTSTRYPPGSLCVAQSITPSLRANPSGADGIDTNSARRKLLCKESCHGVERHAGYASGCAVSRTPCRSIHDVPKRSRNMPKRSAKNVFSIFMNTSPPCCNSPNKRSASSALSTVSET